VWKILQSSKLEFDKFATVLNKAQDRLKQTQEEIETLVGVRTRQINAKLARIQQYTPEISESNSEE
jgi:DNA recombination protein RmuC